MSAPLIHTSTAADSGNELISGCAGYVLSRYSSLAYARGAKQAACAGFSHHDDACAITKGPLGCLCHRGAFYRHMLDGLHPKAALSV